MKVFLIACAKEKSLGTFKAKDLYTSSLFKYNYQYADKFGDKIWILSAKYGLVDPEKRIAYYNETLNEKNNKQIKQWSIKVAIQLMKVLNPKDEVIFLAGYQYRMFLEPFLINKGFDVDVPFRGMPIGKQLHKLKKTLK